MNLCASFLNETKKADISDIIRHVEHIASLGGENIIGMGTDFDGVTMLPEGLENAGRIYKLFDELARLGYSDEFIEKLTYKNFVRLFSEII